MDEELHICTFKSRNGVVITDYTHLKTHKGRKLHVNKSKRYLYLGILSEVEEYKNPYNVTEYKLTFQDKREYIVKEPDTHFLLL